MTEPTTSKSKASTTAPTEEAKLGFAGTRQQFVAQLLVTLCDSIPAQSAAVLRMDAPDSVQMVALHPPLEDPKVAPEWLSQSAELVPQVVSSGRSTLTPLKTHELYGQPASEFLVLVPVASRGKTPEVAAFAVRSGSQSEAEQTRRQLELNSNLMALYDLHAALGQRSQGLAQMRTAMEIVAQVGEHARFRAAAMALCNELAARFAAERVSLGVLRGRYVKLGAISHTDKFTRKMRLVQDLESTMEECLDQDIEVVHPTPPEATFVSRAASQTSTRHGPTAICSLPLRREGAVLGVFTLERGLDKPFAPEEVETLRLTGDLSAPWLLRLAEQDRWFGARLATGAKKTLAAVIGPKHTWAKLTVIGVATAMALVTFLNGTYRVKAPFVIQASEMRIISAPFPGRLKAVNVEPDSPIEKDKTVLAEFDTRQLESDLRTQLAQIRIHEGERAEARNLGNEAQENIALANIDKVKAIVQQLQYEIDSATLKSPFDGFVLEGDLRQEINAQFDKGDPLFKVSPRHAILAELYVPEGHIGNVLIRQNAQAGTNADDPEPLRGKLATKSNPDLHIPFEVVEISPVAQVVEGRNVFAVEAVMQLNEQELNNLRVGLRGVARIDIDRRSYLNIWTYDLVNWLQMKLWIGGEPMEQGATEG